MSITGLREQKKAETRRSLLRAAHDLFVAQGYDETTVDEIADVAQVSRRTLFRYFPHKEDLVFINRAARLASFRARLDDRRPGETAFETLRRATNLFAREYERNVKRIVAQQSLIRTSHDLLARERDIDRDWERTMVDYLTAWAGGGPEAEYRARVLAGASIGVIRSVLRHWFKTGGTRDLGELGQQALTFLEEGFPS